MMLVQASHLEPQNLRGCVPMDPSQIPYKCKTLSAFAQ